MMMYVFCVDEMYLKNEWTEQYTGCIITEEIDAAQKEVMLYKSDTASN